MAKGEIRTTFWPMLGRAARTAVPPVRGAGWFTGWFAKQDRCRTCGYKYERQPGFLLGALTMNTLVTFGLLVVILVVGIVLSYPDVAMVPILAVALPLMVIVPIAFYPFSYTLWAVVDLTMHPLEPAEVADAAVHAGAQGPAPDVVPPNP